MGPRISLRQGAVAGLLAVSSWLALYGIAAVLLIGTPQGYSPLVNHVSDLGNPVAPGAWAFDAACIVAGLLFIPYGLAVAGHLGGKLATAGGFLFVTSSILLFLVGVFPEGSPDDLHFWISAAFFIALTISAAVLSYPLLRSRRFGRISGYLAGATLAGSVATIVTFGTEANPLMEHLAVYLGLAWSAWNVGRMWAMGPEPRPAAS